MVLRLIGKIFLCLATTVLFTSDASAQNGSTQRPDGPAQRSSFYIDLINAIYSADMHAFLTLERGTWKTTRGSVGNSTELIWRIASVTKSEPHFLYSEGFLKNADIRFAPALPVTVIKTVGNVKFCASFKITHLHYELGGGFIKEQSQIETVTRPDCNGKAERSDLSAILDLAIDTKEVFSGRVFIGLGQLGRTIRCRDDSCSNGAPDKGPISQVQLVGKNEIVLKSNVPLNLPAGGFLSLAGGNLTAGNMIYEVPSESGYGQVKDFKVALDGGEISAGGTKMRFAPATTIEVHNVDISKDQRTVTFSGGQFDAQLGPNTTINLTTSGDRSSYVEILRAHAVFSDLDIKFGQDDRYIRFKHGTLDNTQIAAALLVFSTRNSVSMGLTSFTMSFGCDERSTRTSECPGFSWTEGGKNVVTGSLTNLSTLLRPGGRFAVTDSGGLSR